MIVRRLLNHYFPDPEIPLHHRDPFTLLIAVLLSAQSTDAMVNRVTPLLFAQASTPEEMAALSLEMILEIIKPVGLSPTKAKAIKALSQQLLEKHQGKVPRTFEELEALPGVGHKTASVVMVQAFHLPAFPVDTHIYRCAHRWGLSKGKSVEAVEKDLKKIFHEDEWGRVHLQIILYARKYCPARGHIIEKCPICSALKNLASF
ncbi:MAG: endonuclease III [Chlamydiales bacterium]|nr:endonuclease III [Chlamydiales bacterium]